MAKKKKKKTLIFLLLAMILLLIGYLVVVQINNKKDAKEEEEDNSVNILTLEEDSISKIEYSNETGGMTLIKDNDIWYKEDDQSYPINQTKVQNMISSISSISSERLVGNNLDDLSEYGLDKPLIKITVTEEDGNTTVLSIGTKLVTGDGYYFTMNGEGTVYTVDTSIYTSFSVSDTQMIAIEDAPSITSDYITGITINKKDGDDFVLSKETEDTDSSDTNPWSIVKPYSKTIKADSTSVSDYLSNFTSITFSECVDYNADNLKKYGLKNPAAEITVSYYEESSTEDTSEVEDSETTEDTDNDSDSTIRTDYEYKLYIGTQTDDGYYYVKPEDSNRIYLMEQSTVEAMITVNPYDYVSKIINLTNIETLDSMDIVAGGEKYELKIERTTTTNEEDEEEVVSTYYCNGNEVEEDDFKSFYESFLSLSIGGEATKETKDSSDSITITLHKNTGDIKESVIQFLPYDDSFYLVNNEGMDNFITEKRPVEDLLTILQELSKN